MSCVVCDRPEGLYCEFCPDPARSPRLKAISNRDPGDETDYTPPARIHARSYKATYRNGDIFFTQTIIASDSYLVAVSQAAVAGERKDLTLVDLTELV